MTGILSGAGETVEVGETQAVLKSRELLNKKKLNKRIKNLSLIIMDG
ncbi:MAG: hypothetical protein ACI8W9_001394 [Psychromonas sp.]|jgi:hypothetical protein